MRPPRPSSAALLGALALSLLAIAGCTASPARSAAPTPATTTAPALARTAADGVRVIPDLVYGTASGQSLLLDACLPPATEPGTATTDSPVAARASIVMIHGGSWTRGDKADVAYRAVCTWLARSGYPTFAIDYRLAPKYVYPAALDDARTAVHWLRESAQRSRFRLDPERIGAFGGSAGGNLASLLGTAGTGPLTSGTRVAAVVDLSGPADLTGADATPDFIPVQLAYLGCTTPTPCPNARAASPIFSVSADDPPFFIANSSAEKIPIEQSRRFAQALQAAGVHTTFIDVPGGLHSIAMLSPSLRSRILDFYASTLGTNDSADSDGATGAG